MSWRVDDRHSGVLMVLEVDASAVGGLLGTRGATVEAIRSITRVWARSAGWRTRVDIWIPSA